MSRMDIIHEQLRELGKDVVVVTAQQHYKPPRGIRVHHIKAREVPTPSLVFFDEVNLTLTEKYK